MARYTKAQKIADLIIALNEQRNRKGLVPVSRAWTGLGHWLKTEEEPYRCIGRIFVGDDLFIGFLEGLLIEQN